MGKTNKSCISVLGSLRVKYQKRLNWAFRLHFLYCTNQKRQERVELNRGRKCRITLHFLSVLSMSRQIEEWKETKLTQTHTDKLFLGSVVNHSAPWLHDDIAVMASDESCQQHVSNTSKRRRVKTMGYFPSQPQRTPGFPRWPFSSPE